MRTPISLVCSGHAGYSARERSVASTRLALDGLDLSRVCREWQIRSGRSCGGAGTAAAVQTDGSQSDDRRRGRSRIRSSSGRSWRSHARHSPRRSRRHARRCHSFRRSDCSRVRSRSPWCRARSRTISRGPPRLERVVPLPRSSCTVIVSVVPATPAGAVQATSFLAPMLPLLPLATSLTAIMPPSRTSPRVLVPLTEGPP